MSSDPQQASTTNFRIAEWQDWEIPKSILPSCNSAILQFTIAYIPFCHSRSRTQFLRDPHDILLARDRRIFELRRERNRHVHRAQPGNRRVEVVEGALRDNLPEFRGHAVPTVTLIHHDAAR